MSTTVAEAWQDCLERFAQHLAEQRRAVSDGRTHEVVAFVPDVGAPLPPSLAARAQQLHAAAQDLVADLTSAAEDAERQLRAVRTTGTAAGSGTFLDDRG